MGDYQNCLDEPASPMFLQIIFQVLLHGLLVEVEVVLGVASWSSGTITTIGNDDIVGAILNHPYSIGYMEYIVAKTAHLVTTSIINLDGALVRPIVANIDAAINASLSSLSSPTAELWAAADPTDGYHPFPLATLGIAGP